MIFEEPGSFGSLVAFKKRYENFIGGEWVAPQDGKYFDVMCPINGEVYTEVPRSNAKDIEIAITHAENAFKTWKKTSVTERSNLLFKIAERVEQNLQQLAVAETWGNGKPVRETLAADLPLVIDHFKYFASVIRAEEGGMSFLDKNTVSYHIREPLGVVGQIIPWNFPLLMAAWKIAPALAAGNCVILKPAEQTPVSVLLFAELISDILPRGVLNIVNGFGPEAGAALASSPRIAKIAFTGETNTGKLVMKCASENIIPVTLELGGKSPNIFMDDIFDAQDDLVEKCLEGLSLFAFNQGEVCTCPSRALVHERIYDAFMEKALQKISNIKFGNPLDTETMMGAMTSLEQQEKVLNYIEIAKNEGAKILCGGKKVACSKSKNGFYVEPTVIEGNNSMRVFQEEIFGPVVCVTKFKDIEEAIHIANDTVYGLGAGVWTRNIHNLNRFTTEINAGRIWANCYHLYPAHSAFGGFKKSGIGRENHKMILSHYTQTKNVILSTDLSSNGLY